MQELDKIDPLAPAKARGVLRRMELYQADGGCVSGAEAAEVLKISPQAVYRARARGDVLALPSGKAGWVYPVWQFKDGHYLPGMADVLSVLDKEGPFVQCSFLLSRNSLLNGEKPVEFLRRGQLAAVLSAAQSFGTYGSA